MKNKIYFFRYSFLVFLFLISFCCEKSDNIKEPTITDIEGNVYNTVAIGNQIWMKENLKVTKYRNGDPIPNVIDEHWNAPNIGAYCNYGNNLSDSEIYGKLYNWSAVVDSRYLAPEGWHIPTKDDWQELIEYLGGESTAGGKLKETGTIYWNEPNHAATNEYNFSGLPGGYRSFSGTFFGESEIGGFWSSTKSNNPNREEAWMLKIYYNKSSADFLEYPLNEGFSVRCIKD